MHPSPGKAGLWWAKAAVIAGLILWPFLIVDVPPIQDYPNHLARLFVLAERSHDPVLAAMYEPRWRIIPNLAIDVIGPPLVELLPVHVAGRIVLAAALLLPLIGVVVYARAAFGAWSEWSLASALAAYNAIFILGFMNFLYSLGIALLGAAAWIALRERRPAFAVAIGGLASAAIFFCHLLGVLFFAILIVSEEAVRLWSQWRDRRLDSRAVFASAAILLLALTPAIVLYAQSPTADVQTPTLWNELLRKLHELFVPFLAYDKPIALVTGVAVGAAMLGFRKHFTARPAAVLALIILLLADAASPFATKGGSFIETRFPLMMGLLLFAGFRLETAGAPKRIIAAGALAMLMLRIGSVALAWYDHREDLAELRRAIAAVQPGDRVLVASTDSYLNPEAEERVAYGRIIPELSRTDRHSAALLLIERRAFWPLLFAEPTQAPLAVRPPFDAISFPNGEPADYRLLAKPMLAPDDLVGAPYLRDWWVGFDYVLVINAGLASALAELRPDKLQPLHPSNGAYLFKVIR